MIEEFKRPMMKLYEVTDWTLWSSYSRQGPGEIFISREEYAGDLLKRFNVKLRIICNTCANKQKNDASVYQSLVGSLIYLLNTKSDTFHAIIFVSRFINEPSKTSLKQQKGFLGNIQGAKSYGIKILIRRKSMISLDTQIDWDKSIGIRTSTSSHVFRIGLKVISWASRKQKTITLFL